LSVGELIEALEPRYGAVRELDETEGLDQLVLLVLARDLPFKKARAALRRLKQDYVDWNDVRVTPAHELARACEGGGAGTAFAKAAELVELLSTLYLRFNKMTCEVGRAADASPDAAKLRGRLLAFLAERSSLYAALMPLFGATEDDVTISPELTRPLVRLGFVEGRATDAAAREALLKKSKPGERIAAQFVLHQLAARTCAAKTPLCGECPLSAKCPSAKPAEEPPAPKPKKASKAPAKTPAKPAAKAAPEPSPAKPAKAPKAKK
jgi:endonuclease III